MSARPKPKQSEFVEDSPLLKPPGEVPAIRLADLKNDQWPSDRPSRGHPNPLGRLGRLDPLAFARYLITFSLGAAVALAWQSYGDATREAAQLKAISLDREALWQSIDRLGTSIATSQEQMTRRIERGIDRLASEQDQTMREISDLQTFEQYLLDKVSTPAPRSSGIAVSKPVLRSPQAPIQLTPATSP
jgi:hypothetical protein